MLDTVGTALEPDQTALAEAAIIADKRRLAADAEERQKQAAIEAQEAKRTQANADLEEVLEQARDRASDALSDVRLQHDGLQWHLAVDHAQLTFHPFTSARLMDGYPDDPMVAAWAMYATVNGNREVIANIVCEDRPGGLQLFVLRFKANAMVGNDYELGPIDRMHGFVESTFLAQRPFMVRPTTHIWTNRTEPLTPAVLVKRLAIEVQDAG